MRKKSNRFQTTLRAEKERSFSARSVVWKLVWNWRFRPTDFSLHRDDFQFGVYFFFEHVLDGVQRARQ